MNDPRRLRDERPTGPEALLLNALRNDSPAVDARTRALAAALTASAGVTAGTASISKAGLAKGAASKGGGLLAAKAAAAISVGVVAASIGTVTPRPHDVPVPHAVAPSRVAIAPTSPFAAPVGAEPAVSSRAVVVPPEASTDVPRPPPPSSTGEPRTREPSPLKTANRTERTGEDLSSEVAMLYDAKRAIDRHEPQEALVVLDGYRQKFVFGSLRDEATFLRIKALRQSGDLERASDLERAFLRANPKGPLSDIIRANAEDSNVGIIVDDGGQ